MWPAEMRTLSTFFFFIFVGVTAATAFFETVYAFPSLIYLILPSMWHSLHEYDTRLFLSTSFYALLILSQIMALSLAVCFTLSRINVRNTSQWSPVSLSFLQLTWFVACLLFLQLTAVLLLEIDMFAVVIGDSFKTIAKPYRNIDTNCQWAGDAKTHQEHFIDRIQSEYGCCGYEGPSDWYDAQPSLASLPHSCCPKNGCGAEAGCSGNHFQNGCKSALMSSFDKYNPASFGIAGTYLLLKMAALGFCLLAIKTRGNRSRVPEVKYSLATPSPTDSSDSGY